LTYRIQKTDVTEVRLTPPFEWVDAPFGAALCSAPLQGAAQHLFTTRSLTLRGPRADEEWAGLANALDVSSRKLFAPKQVHGTSVLVVRAGDRAPESLNDPERPHADAVVTVDPQAAIAVQVADCVPLLLADPVTGAVAAVHAGWRGTAAAVIRCALDALASQFGTRAADVTAAIGPSIRACCYQVGPDVRDAFARNGFDPDVLDRWFQAEREGDRLRLDVPRANRDQLIAAGVGAANIGDCGLCTACHPALFFSYRRDGALTGRLAAVIRSRKERR
jgi:polyphenol oxidase